MVGALLTNFLALFGGRNGRSMAKLSTPFNQLFFVGQLLFYGAAWLGGQEGVDGKLRKILYVPHFLVNSNWAALIGLYRYVTRQQTTLWQRVNRRPEGDVASE